MATVQCSVRAVKHNIRTLYKMVNQDIIPVVKSHAFHHGDRILLEISRSFRQQPLLVQDRNESELLLALGIDNLIIQQDWDGEYHDQIIPIVKPYQLEAFDQTKPFAIFSDFLNSEGIASKDLSSTANLQYVLYHRQDRKGHIALDYDLQDSIDTYKKINPEVRVSVGTSVDAMRGHGLRPRIGLAIYGYGNTKQSRKALRPVKEVYAKITQSREDPSAGLFYYTLDIGTAASLTEIERLISVEKPEANLRFDIGMSKMHSSVIVSDTRLSLRGLVKVQGYSLWSAIENEDYHYDAMVGDLVLGGVEKY